MLKNPETLAKKLGLMFAEPSLFVQALTHRSHSSKNNERLEFLGDAILGFVIAQKLYERFPEASEGSLSRLRANLVNETSLADLARQLRLGDYLQLGAGELKSGGFRRDSILSDALEAIMGALYLDQGVAACERWIDGLFAEKLASLAIHGGQKDPKTQLQEIMQSRKLDLPEYTLLETVGLSHEQTFTVKCVVSLHDEATIGVGISRKKAEQAAAEKMLKILDKENQ